MWWIVLPVLLVVAAAAIVLKFKCKKIHNHTGTFIHGLYSVVKSGVVYCLIFIDGYYFCLLMSPLVFYSTETIDNGTEK